jgi:predicted nucleic acid binding AN1-type Zn finger protein
MDLLTKYVVYEKISLTSECNNTIGVKIRGMYDNIKDAENAFNKLKEIRTNTFMDTLTSFHSKFSIKYNYT